MVVLLLFLQIEIKRKIVNKTGRKKNFFFLMRIKEKRERINFFFLLICKKDKIYI